MRTLYLSVLLSASCLSGCMDPYPDPVMPEVVLPPVTAEGKNTFGCKINDTKWIPWVNNPSPPFYVAISSDYIFINAWQSTGTLTPEASLVLQLPNITGDSDYVLSQGDANEGYAILDYQENRYQTNNVKKGLVRFIRYDTSEHIISGTFHFDGETSGNSTIHVTDGRFDLKY